MHYTCVHIHSVQIPGNFVNNFQITTKSKSFFIFLYGSVFFTNLFFLFLLLLVFVLVLVLQFCWLWNVQPSGSLFRFHADYFCILFMKILTLMILTILADTRHSRCWWHIWEYYKWKGMREKRGKKNKLSKLSIEISFAVNAII